MYWGEKPIRMDTESGLQVCLAVLSVDALVGHISTTSGHNPHPTGKMRHPAAILKPHHVFFAN